MEPHDEKACRRTREQLVSTAENLSVMSVGIAAAIRDLEWLRKETQDPDAAKAFDVAISVIQSKIHDPGAEPPCSQDSSCTHPEDSDKNRSRSNSPHPEQVTPGQARQLLDGTTPAPWEVESWNTQEVDCPEVTEFWITGHNDRQIAEQETVNQNRDETEQNFTLMAAALDMAAMIAGMATEYRVEVRDQHGKWHHGGWAGNQACCFEPSVFGLKSAARRIAYRYVTKSHPVEEEPQHD